MSRILIFLLGVVGGIAHGQKISDWPTNNAMFFTVNPAYTALAPSLMVGLTHARKWQNIQSSPTQSSLGLILPFSNERMGIGAHLFSEEVGPFRSNGLALSYAYKMPLQVSGKDQLAVGMAISLMHIAFDQNHLIATENTDDLLGGIEGNRFVPPSFSVGFHYQTAQPEYANPVQIAFAGAMARFFPFQNRFNTLSFDRTFQWHGLLGLNILASEKIIISPSLLMSDIERNTLNYGLRIKAAYTSIGWVMTQYSKAGFLTTQLGLNLGAGWGAHDLFEISASNSWYFGTLSAQVGNSLTFALTYKKAVAVR